MTNYFCLSLRLLWATLTGNSFLALKLRISIHQTLEAIMARNFDALTTAVSAVVAEVQANQAAVTNANAALAAEQADAASDQAKIDALTSQLQSVLPADPAA